MQIQKLKQELITNYSSLSEKFEKKQITNQNVVNRLKQFKDYDYKNYFSRFNWEVSIQLRILFRLLTQKEVKFIYS